MFGAGLWGLTTANMWRTGMNFVSHFTIGLSSEKMDDVGGDYGG
jgi:hypothetical protein